MVIGDFNAHHTRWANKQPNTRGKAIDQWAETEGLRLLNEYNIPTRRQIVQEIIRESTIDLGWARGERWKMGELIWQGSDHAVVAASMEIRDTADRAKHTRRRKGISWKKVEKWAEEIVEKKADDKAAMEGLEGETAYQNILSLLGKCQRDFQVNERSKI